MTARIITLASLASFLVGCGGGVPIQIRIDEFTLELDMDAAMTQGTAGLQSAQLLPPDAQGLPALWPDYLPDIDYTFRYPTEPVPIDLTPDPNDPEADPDKYADINKAEEAVERIEINRMVMRIEQSNLSIGLPQLELQLAQESTALEDDRSAWFTIGSFPGTSEAGFVGDIDFEWKLGGESLLNSELGDEEKDLALRAIGDIHINTAENPAMPSGLGIMRLIVVATFFVEPTGAL